MVLEDILKQQNTAKKQDIKEIVAEIFNETNISQKSNLTNSQVAAIAVIRLFGARYKSKVALAIANELLTLKVSEGARGRSDMTKALNAAIIASEVGDKNEMKRRLLGI